MNLVAGWSALMARIPEDVLTLVTMAGVAVIVWALASFFWGNRDATAKRRFSWGAVVTGLILAGPTVTVPVILKLIEGVWGLIVHIVAGG